MPPPAPPPCMATKTVLVVEDSRHASDALRLMLLRLGVRMRRAGSLADARRHLALYRPDAALIDLGLPDGKGESLIASLALAPNRPNRVIALSGSTERRAAALACGADGFIEKPLPGLAFLASALMPDATPPDAGAPIPDPDPRALCDDLATVAAHLRNTPDGPTQHYLAGFVHSLARQTDDMALRTLAAHLTDGMHQDRLLRMIDDRRAALPVI